MKSSWSISQLKTAAKKSFSVRQVIGALGLVPAGGNYEQIKRAIKVNKIDISHFTGQGWKKNRTFSFSPRTDLAEILKKDTAFQSFKLKKRLFSSGIKKTRM